MRRESLHNQGKIEGIDERLGWTGAHCLNFKVVCLQEPFGDKKLWGPQAGPVRSALQEVFGGHRQGL